MSICVVLGALTCFYAVIVLFSSSQPAVFHLHRVNSKRWGAMLGHIRIHHGELDVMRHPENTA